MSLFDPAHWIELPGGSALHRSDCRPCACGNRRLAVVRRRAASGSDVVCPDCYRRLNLAVGTTIGVLDVDAGRFVASKGAGR